MIGCFVPVAEVGVEADKQLRDAEILRIRPVFHLERALVRDHLGRREDAFAIGAEAPAPDSCSFFVGTRIGDFGVFVATMQTKHVYILS